MLLSSLNLIVSILLLLAILLSNTGSNVDLSGAMLKFLTLYICNKQHSTTTVSTPTSERDASWFFNVSENNTTGFNNSLNNNKNMSNNHDNNSSWFDTELANLWEKYKVKFNKTYSDAKDEQNKWKIFLKNLNLVLKNNIDYQDGRKPFKKSINTFSDMTADELCGGYGLFCKNSLTHRGLKKTFSFLNRVHQKRQEEDEVYDDTTCSLANCKEEEEGKSDDVSPKASSETLRSCDPCRTSQVCDDVKRKDIKDDDQEKIYQQPVVKLKKTTSSSIIRAKLALPDAFNWVDLGVVSSVKNQKNCGGCWAFAVIGLLESIEARVTKKLNNLSVKQLIDCSHMNLGCDGGWLDYALEFYINNNTWPESEHTYPFHNNNEQTCFRYPKSNHHNFVLTSFEQLSKNETEMKEMLMLKGPIALGITVTDDMISYNDGVFSDSTCQNQEVNHAVLLVGWGQEGNMPYWLIKNSWGEEWGTSGYLKLLRDKNMCGVTDYAFVANFE